MHAPHHHHPAGHSQPAAPAAPLPVGTVYTCPMHPEIRQPHPGNCPKCGMTLEPVMPEAEEQDNPDLADFQRRFWTTLPLTVVVTVLVPRLMAADHSPSTEKLPSASLL